MPIVNRLRRLWEVDRNITAEWAQMSGEQKDTYLGNLLGRWMVVALTVGAVTGMVTILLASVFGQQTQYAYESWHHQGAYCTDVCRDAYPPARPDGLAECLRACGEMVAPALSEHAQTRSGLFTPVPDAPVPDLEREPADLEREDAAGQAGQGRQGRQTGQSTP